MSPSAIGEWFTRFFLPNSGSAAAMIYGTTDNLASLSAPAGTISYGHDGSLLTSVSQTGAVSGAVTYTHDRTADGDSNFWVAWCTINGDTATSVAYDYDADGLLTAAGPLQIQRDAANGMVTSTTLLQTAETREHNTLGEVTRYRAGFSGTGCTPGPPPFAGCAVVLEQTYVRDNSGRITEKTETLRNPLGGSSETHTDVYTFDPAGRLIQVKRDLSSLRQAWPCGLGRSTNSGRLGGDPVHEIDPGGVQVPASSRADRLRGGVAETPCRRVWHLVAGNQEPFRSVRERVRSAAGGKGTE
jgi:hypothetical protein